MRGCVQKHRLAKLAVILRIGLRVAFEVRGVEPAWLYARRAEERRFPGTLRCIRRVRNAVPVWCTHLHRLKDPNLRYRHRLALFSEVCFGHSTVELIFLLWRLRLYRLYRDICCTATITLHQGVCNSWRRESGRMADNELSQNHPDTRRCRFIVHMAD